MRISNFARILIQMRMGLEEEGLALAVACPKTGPGWREQIFIQMWIGLEEDGLALAVACKKPGRADVKKQFRSNFNSNADRPGRERLAVAVACPELGRAGGNVTNLDQILIRMRIGFEE